MADILTSAERSERMARVRDKNTGPEMAVRRMVHNLGYRYRLHRRDLPGKPDMVFPSLRKVIFIHGCFWHRHRGCKLATMPASRLDYWEPKFSRTVERDEASRKKLHALGWDALVVWECEIRNREELRNRVQSFLE